MENIEIRKARQHNLKGVDLDIPRGLLTVITGVSGSGKSSLAFDTLYAEGQRRYLATLSLYARQFIHQMERAEVETIKGLSPTLSVEQKTIAANPRSTVGSVSEVYDYLRLLFSRVGEVTCPECGGTSHRMGEGELMEELIKGFSGEKIRLLAPLAVEEKGEFKNVFQELLKKGFLRVKIDGEWREIEGEERLEKRKSHTLSVLVDSLVVDATKRERLAASLARAAELTPRGVILEKDGRETFFSTRYYCPRCSLSLQEPEPRLFSYNSPFGQCPQCFGLGRVFLSAYDEIGKLCPKCHGLRLNAHALSVTLEGDSIAAWATLPLTRLHRRLEELKLVGKRGTIVEAILPELLPRLRLMEDLSLGYLTLFRPVETLSGGEAQRIRLASQLGAKLRGIVYVLDEPSIGLHPMDHRKVIGVLRELQRQGNTVVVVEHDEATIREADYVVDLGPGGGERGGRVVFAGSKREFLEAETLTAKYMRGEERAFLDGKRKRPEGWLKMRGARRHNLASLDVPIPLGVLLCITGVSGSGKSTLALELLQEGLRRSLATPDKPLNMEGLDSLEGTEALSRVLVVDQKPIGRNIRSTPATYAKIFDEIRDLFSLLPEARSRGFDSAVFSYNTSQGKCSLCEGKGIVKVELGLLPPVYLKCEECGGKRYDEEVLQVLYKGKSIADILDMTVEEALEHFKANPRLESRLRFLQEIGLDYLRLGQPTPHLSGGEAQRIKLARELGKGGRERTLYLLDEPTVGLHFHDVRKLLLSLRKFTDRGDTVLLIEHNPDVIFSSDYVIDLGPGGGDQGGKIVACGTPEEVAGVEESLTGKVLREVFHGVR